MAVIGANYWSALKLPLNMYPSSGSRANIPLNSAYTYGSAGVAVAIRWQARTADPITEFYIFMDDIVGTLGSITTGCTIRNEHASSATQPGPTIRATGTVTMPNAVDKWIKVAFGTPYTPTVGETLWFDIFNTSAVPGTNCASILTTTSTDNAMGTACNHGRGFSTANGWTSAGTTATETPFVVKQGSNYYGQPIGSNPSTAYASGTTMRGFQFNPPIDVEVCGWSSTAGTVNYTGIRIYAASTAPGGSPLYTYPMGSDTNQSRDEVIASKIWAPITLIGGVAYNVVATYSAVSAVQGGTIEDYASYPTIFDGLVDGFAHCAGVSDVAGSWVVRNDIYPIHQLLVSNFPAPSAGGGGNVKYWNGSAWVSSLATKTWNGSAWV